MCAYQQSNDAFWFLHDSLFRKQNEINQETLGGMIETMLTSRSDIDLTTYKQCVSEHATSALVDADIKLAAKYNVQSTPSIYVNGLRTGGVMSPEAIRALIRNMTSNR